RKCYTTSDNTFFNRMGLKYDKILFSSKSTQITRWNLRISITLFISKTYIQFHSNLI
ncbi:unnamed protein product, partial [Arabidopsis halleri]